MMERGEPEYTFLENMSRDGYLQIVIEFSVH